MTDATGNVLTSFDPALTVTLMPTQDELDAVGDDPTQLSIAILDPLSGELQPVTNVLNADGSLSIVLTQVAPLPASPTAAQSDARVGAVLIR